MDQLDSALQQGKQIFQAAKEVITQALSENPVLIITKQIVITVGDPTVKDTGLSKHTVYNIKGEDRNGAFDVYRRFTDFLDLREQFCRKWPGCYVPPIPDKAIASGNDQEVVESRKRLLDTFVQIITTLPHLYYDDDFHQIFLRQVEIGKSYSNQRALTTQELIDRFNIAFPNLEVKENNNEHVLTITTFQGQLRKSQTYLKNYIESSQLVAAARKQLNEQKLQLLVNILPSYERLNQNEYVNANQDLLVLVNPHNNITQYTDEIKTAMKHNGIDHIVDLFKIRGQRCRSNSISYKLQRLFDSIKSQIRGSVERRQDELSKITMGKQTITTITNSVFNKSKDQAQIKVETKITEGQQEIERTTALMNLVTVLLATHEIKYWKLNRLYLYQKTMQIISQRELQVYEPEITSINLWSKHARICQSNNDQYQIQMSTSTAWDGTIGNSNVGYGTVIVIVAFALALVITCFIGGSSRSPELVCLISMIIPVVLLIFFYAAPKDTGVSSVTTEVDNFFVAKIVGIIIGLISAISGVLCLLGHNHFTALKAIRISSQLEMEREKQKHERKLLLQQANQV